MFALDQPQRKESATYTIFERVFTPEECSKILDLHKSIQRFEGAQGMDKKRRVSDIYWLPWSPDPGIDLLYKKLAEVVTIANTRFWEFHLGGFLEPLQLTHYRAELGGHYDWHADRGDHGIQMNRKVSGTLLLSDDFEGGDFELFDAKIEKRMKAGDLILFPSYHVHKVNPLTAGERWSLVFWVTGPAWV